MGGAVLTSTVVAGVADALRPYLLPGMQSQLDQSRQLRASMRGADEGPGEWETRLVRAIANGGEWALLDVQVTDTRGVETSATALDNQDLSFLDGARDVRLTIAPFQSNGGGPTISLRTFGASVLVQVEASEEQVIEIFDFAYAAVAETVPSDFAVGADSSAPRPFKVFVAYGGGRAWEVVRDYLRDAGFHVEAFTEQERAGEITLDVVEGMIRSASVAVIVMTGADRMEDGTIHARQNVVHETGFAQGAIGRRNTVILREAGVTLPTNVDGLTYIEFERGEIHTTKERVLMLMSRLQSLA